MMTPNVGDTTPLLEQFQETPPKEKKVPKKHTFFEEELMKLEKRAKKRREKENSGFVFRAKQLFKGSEEKDSPPNPIYEPEKGEQIPPQNSTEGNLHIFELTSNPLFTE